MAEESGAQKPGIRGFTLLRDAVMRAVNISGDAGIFAIIVHAMSEQARRFYLSRGFVESAASANDADDDVGSSALHSVTIILNNAIGQRMKQIYRFDEER